jgi:hypothetical protein
MLASELRRGEADPQLLRSKRSERMVQMWAMTRNQLGVSVLGCLTLTAVVVFAIAMPTAAASSRAGFQSCGNIATLTSWDIRAKRVGCPKARQVVRAYNSAIAGGSGPTQDVLGFHCKIAGYYGDGANYRCTAEKHRIVKFSRGG